jgi:hypothetical protein
MKRNGHRSGRFLSVLAILLVSCAREEMPPGTGPDFEAPAVVEMFPRHGSAVPGMDEDAYVRFDEPLGDPRSVARMIETSPAWLYEINAGRSNVRIRPRDGWRPDVVYMFRIPPGLRDLIRNQTREPIELLFTTGQEISGTRTMGTVWDRETVRSVRGAALRVIGGDSVPYAAVADTGGNFVLPALPVGDYWAYAFRDQNQNAVLDRDFEPHDSGLVLLPDPTTVVRLDLWLTSPDSTPPQLVSATATDSLRLRLEFDDLLEPDASLAAASVSVALSTTGEKWPIAEFVVGDLPVVDSTAAGSAGVATVGDSVAAASDSAAPRTDSVQVGPDAQRDSSILEPEVSEVAPPGEAPTSGSAPIDRARPERFVAVRLERALTEGTFEVRTQGFLNLRLLSGGGDTTMVFEAAPPVPDPESVEVGGDVGGEETGEDAAAREEDS